MGPLSVAVADVNGDGRPDLITANALSNDGSVLLGNGNGTFQAGVTFSLGLSPFSVAVADVNSDGRPDLVFANEDNANVSVLLGNGDGTFQAVVNFPTGSKPLAVVVADVNGDGQPDLVVTDLTGVVNLLLGNGTGAFQAAINFSTGPLPYSVAVADVNGDGRPDLITANNFVNSVSVLLNTGNGNFAGPSYTIDQTDPFVVSINRTTPSAAVANAGSVTFTVTFSER